MLGSATTDQELAQLLPEFVQHRLLVHEGEIQRLPDGTPVDIGSLAAALNFTKMTPVVSISMPLALELLQHSGRKPSIAQYQNIAPSECTRPILVMTPRDDAPPFLLDGAARIRRAERLHCQHMQMAFVEEEMVRGFALAPSTIGLAAIPDNPDDALVARLTRLSLAQAQTEAQSQLDRPRIEVAWGTLVPPSLMVAATGDTAPPDREYRVSAQYVFGSHHHEGGKRHGGQASGTTYEKQLRLAIGRIANAFLELRSRVCGEKDRADYLAMLAGHGDRASNKKLGSSRDNIVPGTTQSTRISGLPHVKFILAAARIAKLSSNWPKMPLPLQPFDWAGSEAEWAEVAYSAKEAEFINILRCLGLANLREKERVRISRQIIRSAARHERLSAKQPSEMVFSGLDNRKQPPPDFNGACAIAFHTGINPAYLWGQIMLWHAPLAWIVFAGQRFLGSEAEISLPMAEGYQSARALSGMGEKNHFSNLWGQVEEYLDAVHFKNRIVEGCVKALASTHGFVVPGKVKEG